MPTADPVELVSRFTYLGEQTIEGNGSSQEATLPSETNVIFVSAEGGPIYYSINGDASVNSGGYVPEDSVRIVPETLNLISFEVYMTADINAHLQYFKYE